jgi:peptidoglycan/xylan/chitin deacetylase (PgdA/CDA1 family)
MRLSFLSKSRGIRNLIWRILQVLHRFGFSSRKFGKYLEKYYEIANAEGCKPTLAITAVVMARHPDLIKKLSQDGVEFAIHGYKHIDYKVLTKKEKIVHFQKAIEIFNTNGIPYVGFRAPFLRFSNQTTPILGRMGFLYHSSRVLYWPVLDISKFSKYAKHNHDRLLEFCTPLDPEKNFSLPRLESGLIEIPVSIPDDETIIERLHVTDQKQIADVWFKIFQEIYDRGELFILSLHPERIGYCTDALTDILRKAREQNPSVWVATLKEVAEWWRERNDFTFKITRLGAGQYQVQANCSNRANILVKNAGVNVAHEDWMNGYQIVKANDFILESPHLPVIGLSPDISPNVSKILKNEGYVVEISNKSADYGVYLNDPLWFKDKDEKLLFYHIENSGAPLLKYWRWPDKNRSALSVTGDIDSITITDFVLRIIDNIQCLPFVVRKRRQHLKPEYQDSGII